MGRLRVGVIGAGIGGLTAALTLRNHGVDVTVYEKARELRALGAGVAIAPNGYRVFDGLGIADALTAVAGRVTRTEFYTWKAEPVLADDSVLWGDPDQALSLHRGDFQKVLVDALPDGTIQLGRDCVGATETDDGVRVDFADGSAVDVDLLVGADGIHSFLQGVVTEPAHPVSEGIMAYRGLIPVERLGGSYDMGILTMWLGPGQSFLTYPVSAGSLLNIVAFVPTNLDVEESWTAPGKVAELAASYAGWDERLHAIIGTMDETFRWGIYDRDPLDRWSTDRITLLGDSAHAVTPHLGQGANQAVEDAATLAVLLEGAQPADIPDRLRRYESLRMDRTRQVRDGAREAGLTYRSNDLAPQQQAERIAGIYARIGTRDHDAEQVARDALAGQDAPG